MNYRHVYHAGNFGDVLKHVVLTLCIAHLKRKETPFRVIDTHAGAGLYRLDCGEAERTGEWRDGIARIFGPEAEPLPDDIAHQLAPYLETLQAVNPARELLFYPGSPVFARYALRDSDTLLANELHPEDMANLKVALGKSRNSHVTHLDAYMTLKAALPPKEKRGLILVDPPFEQPGEFVRMTEALDEALRRFSKGIYLLWYPIKDDKAVARFCRHIVRVTNEHGLERVLRVELLLRPLRNPLILNGAGMLIVNPPYQLDETLEVVLPELAKRLGEAKKGWSRVVSCDSDAA